MRRLLKCAGNDLMRGMREIVGIAHGVGNIADLARSCLSWNDTSEGETHKQRWICGYYATSPATSREKNGQGNAGAIALKWWATLRREAAAGESAKREALARMRNARSRLEILMEPETMRLIAKLWHAPQSVATAIAVIVHVTEHDSAPMGRIIGRTKRGDNDSALVRENRFRQVIACTGEDVMQRMRNIIAIRKGRGNVAQLAESCMRWDTPKWGEREKRRVDLRLLRRMAHRSDQRRTTGRRQLRMSKPTGQYLQLHILHVHGPQAANCDETGKPKTADVGMTPRLRISSQCLKRAVRTSDIFAKTLEGHLGTRTRRLGEEIEKCLLKKGTHPKDAQAIARGIAAAIGKPKKEDEPGSTQTEQLVFVAPAERAKAHAFAEAAGEKARHGQPYELAKASDILIGTSAMPRHRDVRDECSPSSPNTTGAQRCGQTTAGQRTAPKPNPTTTPHSTI